VRLQRDCKKYSKATQLRMKSGARLVASTLVKGDLSAIKMILGHASFNNPNRVLSTN